MCYILLKDFVLSLSEGNPLLKFDMSIRKMGLQDQLNELQDSKY